MASIRGTTFSAINSWINLSLGEDDYRKFVRKMRTPVARSLTRCEVWTWYPLEYLTEIYEQIDLVIKNDNSNALEKIGVFLADTDLSGGPKYKESLLPMARVIPRLPSVWSRCRDCGELKVDIIDAGNKEATISLTDYEGSPLHCKVNSAWIKNACKLLSGKQVDVEEENCRWEKGGNTCTWMVYWK